MRVGDAVFRARRIRLTSGQVVIDAEIRSQAIVNHLDHYQERRTSDLIIATPIRALTGQMAGITSVTTSTTRTLLEITLAIRESRGQQSWSFGSLHTNGRAYSAEDLARFALSDGLFGTSDLPTGPGGPSAIDPLAAIRGRDLNDAILRPVAELLVGDSLLRRGEAATVDEIRLGPDHHGVRRLSFSWTPPPRYSNGPLPERQRLEGDVVGL